MAVAPSGEYQSSLYLSLFNLLTVRSNEVDVRAKATQLLALVISDTRGTLTCAMTPVLALTRFT